MVGEGGSFAVENLKEVALADQLLEENSRLWMPRYGVYDLACMDRRLAAMRTALADHVEEEKLAEDFSVSLDFLHSIFNDYKKPEQHQGTTSFAFMVPSRTRRQVEGASDPYKAEWHELFPILQHVDSDTAQRFLSGSPPFVIDWYGQDDEGRRGCMLLAPIFADMSNELGQLGALKISVKVMNDTLAFAKEAGVSTVGLGATLPKLTILADRIGVPVKDQEMTLTTGHASTVWLMEEMTKSLSDKGVVGNGHVGIAYLVDLRQGLGYTDDVYVYDKVPGQRMMAARLHPGNKIANSLEELLDHCKTIVCAATGSIRLADSIDLSGKIIVDDSQPGCFDARNVTERGGKLVWVIASDPTFNGKMGEMTCQSFNYGGSGPANRSEVWGCQVEAWAVDRAGREGLGYIGVRGEVKPVDVGRLGEYLTRKGVKVAPLQAQGQYL